MELSKEGRPARLFFWSLGVWESFLGKHFSQRSRSGMRTNLCYLVRVSFVYMPFVLFLHLLLVFGALFTFVIYPIMLFSWKSYATTSGIGITTIAAIIVVVLVVRLLTKKTDGSFSRSKRVTKRATPSKKEPGFGEILWQWLVATKKKLCPLVSFYGTEKGVGNA